MKKFLVVLLIAVLTVSSAFAALTGEVKTAATYDLDKKNFDIHTTGTIKGSYKLPFAALFAGASDEGKTANEGAFPYAVAEATLTVKAGKLSNDGWDFSGTKTKDAHGVEKTEVPAVSATYSTWGEKDHVITFTDGSASSVKATVKLTKAEIIGEEWKLDFLNGPAVADYSSKDMEATAIIADSTYVNEADKTKATKSGYKFNSISGELSDYVIADKEIAANYVAARDAEVAYYAAVTAKKEAEVALTTFTQIYGANPTDPAKAKELKDLNTAMTTATTAVNTKKAAFVAAKAKCVDYEYDEDTLDEYKAILASKPANFGEGITFTWNKYGSIAVAAKANEKEADSYFLISLESVDYALTDELNGQASVAFDKNSTNKLATYLSGKLAYTNLVPGKLAAKFAIDSKIAKDGGIELNGDFAYDNDFITGEAYYASKAYNYDFFCELDEGEYVHDYDEDVSYFADNFTYFKATVDGTTKYPAFVPEFTAEGYSFAGQDMVANWDLKSTYTKDAKAYFTANIGMTDTLDNVDAKTADKLESNPKDVKGQTLYGSVATTVTNYKTLENIGKLTFKIGAENFLDIDDAKAELKEFVTEKSGAVKTAKGSGFYFNASAEDFVVKGLDFIFSAADLINEKGQVFALDVAYADEEEDLKATAGFATGLKNSVFAGNSSAIYGDVNYKFNEELTGYVGAFAKVGTANWERYYVGADYVKKYADEKTNSISARLDIYHKNGADAEVGLYAKAASTKIVNGAELALTYGSLGAGALVKDTYLGNLTTKAVKDPITATCTIKF